MSKLLLLLLLTTADVGPPVVARLEVNTVLEDQRGGVRFTQLIAWDDWGRVRQWWMTNEHTTVYQANGFYYVVIADTNGVRRMKSPRFGATVTVFDPEEQNRQRLPVNDRWPVFVRE